jgi:hypothetical protein
LLSQLSCQKKKRRPLIEWRCQILGARAASAAISWNVGRHCF